MSAHNCLVAPLPVAVRDMLQLVHLASVVHSQDGAFGHQSEIHD